MSTTLFRVLIIVFVAFGGRASADCIQLKDTNLMCKAPNCADASYSTGGSKATRVALVFGNDVYRGANLDLTDLKNAENDAREMTRRLEGQGFRTRCLLNANASQADKEIWSLATHLGQLQLDNSILPQQIRVVLYFGGHGTEYKGANYVVFSGEFSAALTEDEFRVRARKVDDLLAPLKNTRKSHPLLIVDACRSVIRLRTPGGETVRGSPIVASNTYVPVGPDLPGYFIVYSTGSGGVAGDGDTRFMRYFADEFDSWGRDLASIVTITQTLLVNASQQQQTVNFDSKSWLASTEWRESSEPICDFVQHMLARASIASCHSKSSNDCFEAYQPTPQHCAIWNSQQAFITTSDSCRIRLATAFKDKFSSCATTIASSGTIQDGLRRIQLASLDGEQAKSALAKDRLSSTVRVATTRSLSATPNAEPVASLDRRTQWNDLVAVAKEGAAISTKVLTRGFGPQSPISHSEVVPRESVIELKCEVENCDNRKLSVNIRAKGQTEARGGEIDARDVVPRRADDILILKYGGIDTAAPQAEKDKLAEAVRKHLGVPGVRIRVTGGFGPPTGATTVDRRAYELGIMRAASRSLRIGEHIVKLGAKHNFDAGEQLSSGETTLVETKGSSEVVFVEFFSQQ